MVEIRFATRYRRTPAYTHVHTHTHIYISIHTCCLLYREGNWDFRIALWREERVDFELHNVANCGAVIAREIISLNLKFKSLYVCRFKHLKFHLKFKGRRELLAGSSKGLANFLLNYSSIDFVYLTRPDWQKHAVPLITREIITPRKYIRSRSKTRFLFAIKTLMKKRNTIHSNLSAESKQQLLRGQCNDTLVDAEAWTNRRGTRKWVVPLPPRYEA